MGTVAGGIVLASLALGLLAVSVRHSGHVGAVSTTSTRPATLGPVRCPAVDDGCGPLARPGGVLSTAGGRYRLGQPGDVAVLGRWTCTGVAFPALLRRGTGQVWVFDRWARVNERVTARLAATVPGSRSLRVVPSGDGCDRLEVLRGEHPPVVVRPGPS
jgi:hypothetical protein